jgi:uncharacterized protein
VKNNFSALIVGFLFAIGLGISGMTQPSKVVGFLDLFGNWDPTLIFVMLGAVCIHILTYPLIRKKKTPLFSKYWHVPNRKDITPALIFGSLIFGFGWGLGGYCPGPGITSLASLQTRPFIFVISMIMGMGLFRLIDKKMKFKK